MNGVDTTLKDTHTHLSGAMNVAPASNSISAQTSTLLSHELLVEKELLEGFLRQFLPIGGGPAPIPHQIATGSAKRLESAADGGKGGGFPPVGLPLEDVAGRRAGLRAANICDFGSDQCNCNCLGNALQARRIECHIERHAIGRLGLPLLFTLGRNLVRGAERNHDTIAIALLSKSGRGTLHGIAGRIARTKGCGGLMRSRNFISAL